MLTHSVQARNNISLATLAAVLVIIALIVAATVAAHVVRQLDAMSASLDHVSSSLETLQSMNSKLDTLDGVSMRLRQMNASLAVTNRSLDEANQKLSRMAFDSKKADNSLDGMRFTLGKMQRDIQTMSQKISGSFLFRSVKSH